MPGISRMIVRGRTGPGSIPFHAVRSNLSRSLDRALIALFGAGLVLAGVETALLPFAGPLGYAILLFPLVFLVYVAAGLRAWYRRPGNRMGSLILFGGFAVFLAGLSHTSVHAFVVAGTMGATLALAVTIHMLHAFPSGRLQGRISRATVAAAYVNSLFLQAPGYLFATDSPLPGLFIAENRLIVNAAAMLQSILGSVIMLATAFVLIRRLILADPEKRRVLGGLFAYGAFAVVIMPMVANVLGPILNISLDFQTALQLVVVGGIPLAFSHAILRGGFAKTGQLEELGSWLGSSGGSRSALAAVLARTLGDPSLVLSFWVARQGIFVTEEGMPAPSAPQGSGRGLVEIELGGRIVGAIDYDATLIEERELVRAAGQVVAIAVDRERLTAELRESHGNLQRSRERLVDAADRERRRIAADLHDGLQMHLVLLALEAQKLANSAPSDTAVAARATHLRQGIDSAAADLRQLVHNVMPAALIERGLAAAAEDLADRMPVPTTLALEVQGLDCPPAVESTAYFVLAEGLTNVIKHARASKVSVTLRARDGWLLLEMHDNGIGGAQLHDGTGLRGVCDRVDVLGGSFIMVSDPGKGTHIVVELPCA